jgi:hypothetical protein
MTGQTERLRDIWSQAGDALASADQVDIHGYSLPASDGAARALFNQLRIRLRDGRTHVHVHDPNDAVRKNWRAFLGKAAKITADRLGIVEAFVAQQERRAS